MSAIRVLQVLGCLDRGGAENMIMSVYRNIDREKIQFDFIYFKEVENDFKDEIKSLGGQYYKFPSPSLKNNHKKEYEEFFKKHKNNKEQ